MPEPKLCGLENPEKTPESGNILPQRRHRDFSFLPGSHRHLRCGDVLGYRQHSRCYHFAIEPQNRGLGALRRRHGDDGETARLAAFARLREMDFSDIAVRGK